LKAEAESILDQIGLSSSDAIRMFYKQITLRKGLPFEARIPNATTQKTDQKRIKALEELSALDQELGLG